MITHPMKLLTIVAEALVRKPIEALLSDEGAHGFTVFSVEGRGAGGARFAELSEYANIQFEVVVPEAVAQRLLQRLHDEFLPRYGLIVLESDVRVLRPHKF